jgi:hypothetical protein
MWKKKRKVQIDMLLEVAIAGLQAISGGELDEIFSLAVGGCAIILLTITLIAYRKTNLTRLLLVSVAFGLFALKTVVRHLDLLIFNWGAQTTDLLYTAIDLVILILFFLAVIVKT